MPTCEMCGRETNALFKAVVEGATMEVCEECAKFGKIVERPRPPQSKKEFIRRIIPKRQEVVQTIVDNYAELVRNAREKRGLKQEELAKMLAEKESIIQKIETGKFKPSIELARKLERRLGIKLVEEETVSGAVPLSTGKTESFTMEHFMKKK